MATHHPKYDRATIDLAVSMVTGGAGRPRRTQRSVARELGVSNVTVHKWVYRAAREATAGQYDPLREPDHEDLRRPMSNATPTTPARTDWTTHRADDCLAHDTRECERLIRENDALKATVVLLVRDLDNRE